MSASEAIYYSWGRALPASLQQRLEAHLEQPLRPLSSLSELPAQAGLIWAVSASESAQSLLQQLYQLRVQQGQRGPIGFYLRQAASKWLKDHPWLSAPNGSLLPGFVLLEAEGPEARQVETALAPGLLSESEWQQTARALCWQKLVGLRHDLQHALHGSQRLSALLRERLASLPQDLGLLAPLYRPLLAEIQQQLQAPPVVPRRLKPLLQQLWQGLASDTLQPEQTALSRGLYQLRAHWHGSLQAQSRFAAGLGAYSAAEPVLAAALNDWLQAHPARQLEHSAGLLAAAKDLKQLLQQRPASQRHTPLSQWLHNTLDQHLYTAAALIRHWEPRWQASQQHHAALQLERLPHSVPGWGLQAPLNPGPGNSLRKLLIIEDDPVWQTLLRQQLEAVLARFLQQYPTQQGFDWQVVVAGHLDAAEAHLPESLLVLADLSMPRQPGETARREHGLAFLQKHFGTYKRQSQRRPVIVHSVPGWWLQDQQALLAAGVAEADIVPKSQHSELLDQRVYDWLCQWRTRQIGPERFSHCLLIRSGDTGSQLLLDGMALRLSPQEESLLLSLAERGRRGLTAAAVCALGPGESEADNADSLNTTERRTSVTERAFEGRLQQLLADIDRREALEMAQQLRRLRHLWHENSPPQASPRQSLLALLKALQGQRSLLYWLEEDRPQAAEAAPCLLSQSIASRLPALANLPPAAQLAAFFATETPAAGDTGPDADPDADPDAETARQRHQASDRVYRLKASLSAQARQLGVFLDPNSVIGSEDSPDRVQGPHYRLQPQVQVQWQPLAAAATALQVLVLEDDPLYAAQIQDALDRLSWLEGLQLETLVISDLRSLQGAALRPDWLLLDLHLPAVPGGPASEDGGLRALQQIRQHCQQHGKRLQTLVISALAHDDDLRLQARQLAVPLQDFVPKGESLYGLPWPESLDLALRQSLRSWQQAARLLPLTAAELRQRSHLGEQLPLSVEVRYWGQRRSGRAQTPDRELELWVTADGPAGRSASAVIHSGARAAFLAALLRAYPEPVDADSLSLWLLDQHGQRPESAALADQQRQLTNLLNRLRKEEISKHWPLEVLRTLSPELAQPNPARHVLRQQQNETQRHYWLALRGVSGQEQIR